MEKINRQLQGRLIRQSTNYTCRMTNFFLLEVE